MIRAILYDLDGTLIDSEPDNIEAFSRVLARHNVAATDEERAFVVGNSWNEVHAMMRRNHPGFALSRDELIAEAFAERARLVGEHGVRPLPGSPEVPRRLASRFAQAIVSGSARAEVAMSVSALGLDDVFPWFVASEDYGAGKPAPEPYLAALARLGARASDAVAIEDTRGGIAAARAAGLRVIAVRAGCPKGEDQSAADVVVDTLLDAEVVVTEKW